MTKRLSVFLWVLMTVWANASPGQPLLISESYLTQLSPERRADTLIHWSETNFYYQPDSAIAYLNKIAGNGLNNFTQFRLSLAKAEAYYRKKDTLNVALSLNAAKSKKKYCDNSELLLKYYLLHYNQTEFFEKNYAKAITYIDSGIALTANKYIEPGEFAVRTFITKADFHQKSGDKQHNLNTLLNALARAEGLPNKNLKAQVLVRLGNFFRENRSYFSAIDYYKQLIEITRLQADSNFMATALHFTAFCLKESGGYDEALQYCLEAYQTRLAIKDLAGIPPVFSDAAFTLNKMGKADSAIKLLNRYYQISDSLQIPAIRSFNTSFVYAESLILLKQWNKAKKWLDSLEKEVPEQYKNASSQVWLNNLLGVAYYESGNEAAAYKYFKRNEDHNFDQLLTRLKFDHYYYISLLEFKKGNFERFKHQTEELRELAKTIGLERNTENFSETQSRILIQQRLQESAKYRQELTDMQYENELEKAKKKNLLYIVVIFGLTALIFVIAFILNKRSLRIIKQQNAQITNQQEEITQQNVELEAQNERLQELDLEKNNVLRIASHDLKAPLSRVLGLINLIELDEELLNEEQKSYVKQIKYILNTNNSMITKLLDLNAIEESGIKIERKEFDLAEMIENLLGQYQYAFEKRKITPHLQVKMERSKIMGDPHIINGILDNLISNAIKFSADEKPIEVSVFSKDNFLRVEVSDRGPGIKDSEKNKVFKKFEKLSGRPKQGESSSGLGLYIAKSYVQKLNGIIEFKNRPEGGTTFYFELPLG